MSLDVTLTQNIEISRRCPHCQLEYKDAQEGDEIYSSNITHNLVTMADKAGIYEALWRPDEHGITTAGQLIEPLRNGLKKLKLKPEYFSKFNASNGWGLYEHFVPFVEEYLTACEENPTALVSVSR